MNTSQSCIPCISLCLSDSLLSGSLLVVPKASVQISCSFFCLFSLLRAMSNTSIILRELTSSDSAHRLLWKHDVAAQASSMGLTPEICFEAIPHVSSKRHSYTNVIQGHCTALSLQGGQHQRGLQPASATTGIVEGICTACGLSLVVPFSREDLLMQGTSLHLVWRLKRDHISKIHVDSAH